MMARPNKSGLTPNVVNQLLRSVNPATGKHYTQTEIAGLYGVSKQHVSWIKSTYKGVDRSKREIAMDKAWPWKVADKFHHAYPAKKLGDHIEYMATGGDGMSGAKLQELRRFYNRIERNDLVVEFDPELPPSEGISTGGWAYRVRNERDGDLIIRVNEHARPLTEEARTYWLLPPVLPGESEPPT